MKADASPIHTFVICAYQESPFLEICINSLLKQTVSSRICIVTSTPCLHISRLAEKYHLPVLVNGETHGLAEDWNFAVSSAATPYVTLAHQDDIYLPRYTQTVLEALGKCSHPLIAFTDYYERRMNANGKGQTITSNALLKVKRLLLAPLRLRMFWGNRFVRRRILSLGSAICCPSVTLVKKNLELPVFENNMKSNIDWQAWEKISCQRGEFAYVAKPSVIHRIHPASATSDALASGIRREEDLNIYRKFWPEWVAKGIEYFYQKSEASNNTAYGEKNKCK